MCYFCYFFVIHVLFNIYLQKNSSILNYEAFKKMLKQPIIINSSRGSIVNEDDLLKAYDEKLISGFSE